MTNTMQKKLSILQCGGCALPISGSLKYAGTERIVWYLSNAFASMGHQSYVAAPGDSNLGRYGTLLPTIKKSEWGLKKNNRTIKGKKSNYPKHYQRCLTYAEERGVDIIQDHPGSGIITSIPYIQGKIQFPVSTTLHGRPSLENERDRLTAAYWREFQGEKRPIFFNAISEAQRSLYEKVIGIKVDKVIPHGVPTDFFRFQEEKANYLFWIGRINIGKGTDIAARVAKRTGMPLIIAGEVHTPNRSFYETKVKPLVDRTITNERERDILLQKLEVGESIVNNGEVLYIGPVDDRQKEILFRHAQTKLMLNRWPEPFGLVVIEALATGTPVIGTNRGSLPELIKDENTGFLLETGWTGEVERNEKQTREFVERVSLSLEKIKTIPNVHQNCRRHIEENFSLERMGKDYIDHYQEII